MSNRRIGNIVEEGYSGTLAELAENMPMAHDRLLALLNDSVCPDRDLVLALDAIAAAKTNAINSA